MCVGLFFYCFSVVYKFVLVYLFFYFYFFCYHFLLLLFVVVLLCGCCFCCFFVLVGVVNDRRGYQRVKEWEMVY